MKHDMGGNDPQNYILDQEAVQRNPNNDFEYFVGPNHLDNDGMADNKREIKKKGKNQSRKKQANLK